MDMPNFSKTVMLTNSQGKWFSLSYSETAPFLGLCGQIPSTIGIPQALPVNMFVGTSIQDVISQAKTWGKVNGDGH